MTVAAIRHDRALSDCPLAAERVTLLGMIPRVTRLLSWDGDLPDVGEYLETKNGATYVVIAVKPNTRSNAKSVARLDILRLDIEDIEPDRPRHQFRWISSRKRRRIR